MKHETSGVTLSTVASRGCNRSVADMTCRRVGDTTRHRVPEATCAGSVALSAAFDAGLSRVCGNGMLDGADTYVDQPVKVTGVNAAKLGVLATIQGVRSWRPPM